MFKTYCVCQFEPLDWRNSFRWRSRLVRSYLLVLLRTSNAFQFCHFRLPKFTFEIEGHSRSTHLDKSVEWSSSKSIIFWLELGHWITHLDKSDGWTLISFESEKFQNTTIIIDISINQDEKSGSLVIFCCCSEFWSDCIEFIVWFGNEEEKVLSNITTKDFWGSFFIKFIDF